MLWKIFLFIPTFVFGLYSLRLCHMANTQSISRRGD